MSPETPVLEDAYMDDAEETPDTANEPDDSAKSLDDIIDAYAKAIPGQSTSPER